MAESKPVNETNEEVESELHEDLAAELKKFIESVGGFERAKQLFGDLEKEDSDELKEAA